MNCFHNNLKPKNRERGVVLVGVIAVMICVGLFAAVGTSFIASSAGTNQSLIMSSQALAIANAGAQCYLMSLKNDTDWTNATNSTTDFAEGRFKIVILAKSSTEVTFRSIGIVYSAGAGVDMMRYVELTAQKTPSAFKFALFQGYDSGGTLKLKDKGTTRVTRISGNVWSAQSAQVDAPNQVTNGLFYVPGNKDVTGSGTYTKKLLTAPYPVSPALDSSGYKTVMNNFDTLLNADNSAVDLVLVSGTFNVSGNMNYRSFTTLGNVTIKGEGTIVAKKFISLHAVGLPLPLPIPIINSLNIQPTVGKTINFVTQGNLTVGPSNNSSFVTNSENVVFYSRSVTPTTDKILIGGGRVNLMNAKFYSRCRIDVVAGADISGNSLVYIDDAYPAYSNFMTITGSPDVTTISGNLIAISNGITSIRLQGAPDKSQLIVNGLVYASGSSAKSACYLDEATVNGSVDCDIIKKGEITAVDINYQLLANVPKGFQSSVSVKDNSWDSK